MKQLVRNSFLLLAAMLLSACGSLLDMGANGSGDLRRLYVNDGATNDSLRRAVSQDGVYFVVQPKKSYTFSVTSSGNGELLQILKSQGGYFVPWQTVTGVSSGATRTFTFSDTVATEANYFLARLQSSSGASVVTPDVVRLFPAVPALAGTLAVRLVLVQKLKGLATDSAKAAFAREFLTELKTVYATYGVSLDTSSVIIPGDAGMAVDFNAQASFPGTRVPNTVHMYLVDSIYNKKGNPGDLYLGYAPREAFDLATTSRGSQVVLNVRALEVGGTPTSVAVTAAHELGHFLGLRHTTPTDLDRLGDDDLSNTDDGFSQTAVCTGLEKRSGGDRDVRIVSPDGQPYCLRIAAGPERCSCPDRFNLMFAYQCPNDQKTMVSQQQTFMRQNLSLFQR